MKLRYLLLAVAGAIALGGRPRAANLEIAPVLVELGRNAPSATVTVRNGGTATVRYQVYAMAWTEPAPGDTRLVPSDELSAFPPLFSLGPGEERKVRVGATVQPGAEERAWRLFVEELPSAVEASGAGARVAIRTRFAIPVFLAPAQPRARLSASLHLAGRTLRSVLRNEGNVHVRPRSVTVTYTSLSGAVLHTAQVSPAVLLALAERSEDVAAPPAKVCGQVRKATIVAELADGPVQSWLALPDGGCAP